jgi:hypothetical protein
VSVGATVGAVVATDEAGAAADGDDAPLDPVVPPQAASSADTPNSKVAPRHRYGGVAIDRSNRLVEGSPRGILHRAILDGMRFRTTLQLEGKTATGFRVPVDVVEAMGRGKRPPVTVTINGYTYRSTVAAYGDVFMLPLAAEHREAAGVQAWDEIDVEVELDEAPRDVAVPPDFAAALDADAAARRTFDALSNSNKKWHVLSVEGAKTDETRQRRIEKSITTLREGKPR